MESQRLCTLSFSEMTEIDSIRNWRSSLHQIPKIIFPKIIFEKEVLLHHTNLFPFTQLYCRPFSKSKASAALYYSFYKFTSKFQGSTSPNPKSDLKPWHLCLSLQSHIYNCLQCIWIWLKDTYSLEGKLWPT